jgi:hypothetical protein
METKWKFNESNCTVIGTFLFLFWTLFFQAIRYLKKKNAIWIYNVNCIDHQMVTNNYFLKYFLLEKTFKKTFFYFLKIDFDINTSK